MRQANHLAFFKDPYKIWEDQSDAKQFSGNILRWRKWYLFVSRIQKIVQ